MDGSDAQSGNSSRLAHKQGARPSVVVVVPSCLRQEGKETLKKKEAMRRDSLSCLRDFGAKGDTVERMPASCFTC